MRSSPGPRSDPSSTTASSRRTWNISTSAAPRAPSLAWGGERLNRATNGHYLQPALFVNTKNGMRINREEIFGPIASVIRVDDYDQALATANDTAFGLSSGIFTTSLKHAAHFRKHSEAGMVMVNVPTPGSIIMCPLAAAKARATARASRGARLSNFSPPRERIMFCRVSFCFVMRGLDPRICCH